eukprot:gnl/TRDRNA2_/TRDRNA2_159343_c1_seq1.p1 gnl/TRDRNA2_/TRDRNA2_159343_c1~~gnl/TRDRNA2_/TRDRNA2_159343_c1_seq1.p1  ORF type:complete len:550 (+),score=54.79 gnl/TRDRNA2_/TRDRNA2_159343_c1_seq1:34-1650(+)
MRAGSQAAVGNGGTGAGIQCIAAAESAVVASEHCYQLREQVHPEVELLFLGTGSAEPSLRRAQSGIWIRFAGAEMLLEAGGGTWAQMVRLLGHDGAVARMASVRLVWVSHSHADHCIGLPQVLKYAHQAIVVAPTNVLDYLRSFCNFASREWSESITSRHWYETHEFTGQQLGGIEFLPVPVLHCFRSYALIIRCARDKMQIVFSGDCRPSENLIKTVRTGSMKTTWLVHEATFDLHFEADAVKKRHSTVSEAVSVGQSMGAEVVVLTHFSQRYSLINTRKWISDRMLVCAAFDGLWLSGLDQIRRFVSLTPALESYFAQLPKDVRAFRETESFKPKQPLPGTGFPSHLFEKCVASQRARQEDTSLCRRLRRFYEEHNPGMESKAPLVARMFEGRLEDLNTRLRGKYAASLHSSSWTQESDSSSTSEGNSSEESTSIEESSSSDESHPGKDGTSSVEPPGNTHNDHVAPMSAWLMSTTVSIPSVNHFWEPELMPHAVDCLSNGVSLLAVATICFCVGFSLALVRSCECTFTCEDPLWA